MVNSIGTFVALPLRMKALSSCYFGAFRNFGHPTSLAFSKKESYTFPIVSFRVFSAAMQTVGQFSKEFRKNSPGPYISQEVK